MMRRLPRKPTRLQQLVHTLRTEGASRTREAWAIGLGIFVGCSPFIGLHLAMCVVLGYLFGLNRLKLYLAANLVNPLVLPFVLFAEVQAGSWIRRGHGYPLSLEAIAATHIWHFGTDLVLGSVVVGGVLGLIAGGVTYASFGRSYRDPEFAGLVRGAADRYLGTSITAWEFARSKLRRDPVYRAVITSGWLPAAGRLLDVGCGQGLLLALVAESRAASHRTGVPAALILAGIEMRPRVAAMARHALEPDAEIEVGDARTADLGHADVVALFDVLHLVDPAAQRLIVERVAAALAPDGRLLLREADAAAGWRFQMVRFGNRLTALSQGRWRAPLSFRTAAEWRHLLAQAGLAAHVHPMGDGTPFANVLLVGTKTGQRAPVPDHAAASVPHVVGG